MELIFFSRHSSEIRGLCLLKCTSKMLQKCLNFWNVNSTYILFFIKKYFFCSIPKNDKFSSILQGHSIKHLISEEWQHILCLIFISLNQIKSIFFLSQSMRFKIEIVLSPYSIWQGVTQILKTENKVSAYKLKNFYFFR